MFPEVNIYIVLYILMQAQVYVQSRYIIYFLTIKKHVDSSLKFIKNNRKDHLQLTMTDE